MDQSSLPLPQSPLPLLDGRAWWGALCVVGLAILLGWLMPPWRARRGRFDDWLARTAAGLGLAAELVLGVGQGAGWLWRMPWGVAGAAGGLLAAWAALRAVTCAGGRVFGSSRARGLAHLAGLVGWGVLLFWIALLLLPAAAPSINYDALEYHVGIVPEVFQGGRFRPIPHVFYTRQPVAGEALYTLASIAAGSPWSRAPGFLHWLAIALTALIVARLLGRLGVPRSWRPWLALLLFTHPDLLLLQIDRMTDAWGVLMLAAGLLALAPRGRLRVESLALAGLIAGAAVAFKWTHAGTVALPLTLVALALGWRRRDGLCRKRAAAFAAGALIALAPWIVYTWSVAGNPLAPFLASVFPDDQWTPAQLAFLMETHRATSMLEGAYWRNLAVKLSGGRGGLPLLALGLTAWAGVMAAAMARWNLRRRWCCALGVGMIAALLAWGGLLEGAIRFLAPVMLAALLLIAVALSEFVRWARRRSKGGGNLAAGCVLAALIIAPGLKLASTPEALTEHFLPVATGRIKSNSPSAKYWQMQLGATADLFELANALPAGSRIMAVNEARRYAFRHPVTLASVFDRHPLRAMIADAPDSETLRRRLVAEGYTHLLYNGAELLRLLAMHTPPALIGDPEFKRLMNFAAQEDPEMRQAAFAALATDYRGTTEFATNPLNPRERKIYFDFLDSLQRTSNPVTGTSTEMWIAPLDASGGR